MLYIFDVDDVLLDWESHFRAFLNSKGYAPDPTGPTSWDLSPWIGCTQIEARKLIEQFNISHEFGYLRALPGAVAVIRQLREADHRIVALTSCGDMRSQIRARAGNLASEFGDDAFDSLEVLPLGESKLPALIRYSSEPDARFLDDSFSHAERGAIAGIRSYCLRRTHNRSQERAATDSSVIWIDAIQQFIA